MTTSAPLQLPDALQVIERGWLSSNNIVGIADGQAMLIDSGYGGQAGRTVDLVRQAIGARPLVRLINTHSHSDHIGGNAALQREFGCEIVIPAGIEDDIATWNEQTLLLTPAAQRADRFRHDGVIHPGEHFMFGGCEWQAHAAPGHDMAALVFHCPERRLLISGDALWEDGFGIVFADILGNGGGLAATRSTLDMLGELDVDVVIPGHGRVFRDPAGALHRARRRLAAFAADPARMARNAVKACFTFNLLDLGRLPLADLERYVASVPLFSEVGTRLLGMAPDTLAHWLLAELRKAGAVVVEEGFVVPTMAA